MRHPHWMGLTDGTALIDDLFQSAALDGQDGWGQQAVLLKLEDGRGWDGGGSPCEEASQTGSPRTTWKKSESPNKRAPQQFARFRRRKTSRSTPYSSSEKDRCSWKSSTSRLWDPVLDIWSVTNFFSVCGLLSPTDLQVNKNGWAESIGTPAAQRWIFLKRSCFVNLMFLCWYVSTKRIARPHLWISQVVSVLFSQLGKTVGQEEEKEVNIEQTK